MIAVLALAWWSRPRQAPEVTLTTLSGEKITLKQLRGHPVLLNFWASDCPACLKEMPLLARIHHSYTPAGLKIYAVAMPYDPPNRTLGFLKSHPLPYPVVLDPFGRISQPFRVTAIPTSVVIAPDGTIAWRHTGIPDLQRIQSIIETLTHRGA